jgi:hypothetical protein
MVANDCSLSNDTKQGTKCFLKLAEFTKQGRDDGYVPGASDYTKIIQLHEHKRKLKSSSTYNQERAGALFHSGKGSLPTHLRFPPLRNGWSAQNQFIIREN